MSDHRFIVYTSDEPDSTGGGGDDNAVSFEERRRDPRYRVGVFAEIERSPGGCSRTPGLTYNVSRSGALLLTMSRLEPGEEVLVSFVSSANDREDTPVRVVHEDPFFESMIWSRLVGVEFVDRAPSFLENELSFTR